MKTRGGAWRCRAGSALTFTVLQSGEGHRTGNKTHAPFTHAPFTHAWNYNQGLLKRCLHLQCPL